MKKLQLTLGLLTAITYTAATAYIEPLDLTQHDFTAQPEATDVQCAPPDSKSVLECTATYPDGSTRQWWLKMQADGKVYRYAEYPATGVKPVPFRR